MELNTKQQEVYDEVLNGTENIIILTGEGGVGKTQLVALIV
jgi:putative ribosome biogenesis GTPase RsgA